MATSITTQSTMTELEILSDVQISNLSTPRMRDSVSDAGLPFPWRALHERAWARVVRELIERADPIEETSLSTPSELARATCYLVASYAYEQGESPNDMERSKYFHNLHLREMAEVRLTLAGGTLAATKRGYGSIRMQRGA
jgi:hypothetical protein